jgi:hypothetical protein
MRIVENLLNSNSNLNVTLPANLTPSFITLGNFFEDVSFLSIVLEKMCETHLIVYHNLLVRYHEISTEFIIFKLNFVF